MKKNTMLNRILSCGLALALFVASPVSVIADDVAMDAPVETTVENTSESQVASEGESEAGETPAEDNKSESDKASADDAGQTGSDDSTSDDVSENKEVNTDDARAGATVDKSTENNKSDEEAAETEDADKEEAAESEKATEEETEDTEDETKYTYFSNNDGTHKKTWIDEDGEEHEETEDCQFDEDGVCELCGYDKNDGKKITLTDSNDLVKITAKKSVLNGAVKVTADEITEKSDKKQYNEMADALDEETGDDTAVIDFIAYDINLYNEDGDVVEPTGEVKVEFTSPSVEGLNDDSYTTEVYHYEDSSVNKMADVTPSNDSVEMTTDHFSTYIIAIKENGRESLFDSKYITVYSEDNDWAKSDTLPTVEKDVWDNGYSYDYYTEINGKKVYSYFPIQVRVYLEDSEEPVETLGYTYTYITGNKGVNNDSLQRSLSIVSEDYVIESVKYGSGQNYDKSLTQSVNGPTTYSIGFNNYLANGEWKSRWEYYCGQKVNFIDVYLTESNLDIYTVEGATLIDYKDTFVAGTTTVGSKTVNAFLFSGDKSSYKTENNAFEGDNYHYGETIYQGLASNKYTTSFALIDSIAVKNKLFPTKSEASNNSKYLAAAYDAKVQFVKEDGYYVLDSDKYGYDLIQDNGASANNLITDHATLKVKSTTEEGFWPLSGYHFGMDLPIEFAISSDGQTTINNQKQDTVFEFSGDDDVFVYIDGELVLDLGGVHGKVSGSINFNTGKVHVIASNYYIDEKGDGQRTDLRKEEYDLDLYTILGTTRTQFSKKTHTMHVVYFERGANQSNCKIKYNFVPINTKDNYTKNITLNKTWDDNDSSSRPTTLTFNIYGTYTDNGTTKYIDCAGNTYDSKEDAISQYTLTADDGWTKTIKDVPVFQDNDTSMLISWHTEEVVPLGYERTGYNKTFTEETTVSKEDMIPEPATSGGAIYSHFDIELNAVSDDDSVGARTIESIKDLNGTLNAVSLIGYYTNSNSWQAKTISVAMEKSNSYEWRASSQMLGENSVLVFYVKYAGSDDYKLVVIDKNSSYPDGAKYYKHSTEFSDQHEPYRNIALYYTGTTTPSEGYVDLSGENLFTTALLECPVTVATGLGTYKNSKYGYNYPGLDIVLSPKTVESISIEATANEIHTYTNTLNLGTLTFEKEVNGDELKGTEYLYSFKVERIDGNEATLVEVNDQISVTSTLYDNPINVGYANGIFNLFEGQKVVITGLLPGEYRVSEIAASKGKDYSESVSLDVFTTEISIDGQIVETDNKFGTVIVASDNNSSIKFVNSLKTEYSWTLKKVSSSATNEEDGLTGAEFKLTNNSDSSKYYIGRSGEKGIVAWTDVNGNAIDTTDLENGEYTLEETKAPSEPIPYALNSEKLTVTIDKYQGVTVSNGDTVLYSTSSEATSILVRFEDDVAYTLPETGGSGVYVYTIGGILLMLAGALLLYKNKNNKK